MLNSSQNIKVLFAFPKIEGTAQLKPSGADTGIFLDNKVNNMAVDALAPCVIKSWAIMVIKSWEIMVLIV